MYFLFYFCRLNCETLICCYCMGCRWQLHMLIKKEVENEMDDEEIENNEEDGGSI